MASQYGLPTGQPIHPQRPGEQDCRDYLRTGRCKYGESCKYNHPPGVQSGGGMKAPDGGFPIRPNEPICQYYLKHGTCKFGHTCKFNHPPHVLTSGGGGGGPILPAGAVLMNVSGLPGQQVIAINDGSGMRGDRVQHHSHQVVQLLPQRPGEPDCIYFLRNGRCKYGATCKYHHPLTNTATSTTSSHPHHLHQQHHHHHVGHQTRPQHQQHESTYAQRIGRGRSSPSTGSINDGYGGGGGGGTYAQRTQVQVDQPTHFVVSDGSFQAVSLRSTHPTASSSLASSYETATSSLQNYRGGGGGGYPGQDGVAVDSSGRVWRRDNISGDHPPSYGGQRRSSSQEQLHESMGHRSLSYERIRGPPSSDGGPGLPRHESHSSFVSARMGNVPPSPGGESSSMGSRNPSMSSLQRAAATSGGVYYGSHSAVDSDRSWASPDDYGVPRTGSGAYLSTPQFALEEDEHVPTSGTRRHAGNGHQSYENGNNRRSGGDDQGDGLSSMTSALLSMLDTTDRDASGRQNLKSSPEKASKPDPRSPQHSLGDDASSRSGEHGTPSPHGTPLHQRMRYSTGTSSMPTHMEDYEPSFLSGSRHSDDDEDGCPTPRAGVSSRDQAYNMAWNGSRQLESNAQSVSMLQSAASNPPPPPPGGFYLP